MLLCVASLFERKNCLEPYIQLEFNLLFNWINMPPAKIWQTGLAAALFKSNFNSSGKLLLKKLLTFFGRI